MFRLGGWFWVSGVYPGCTPGSGGSLQVPPSRAALQGNSSGQLHRGETSFPREAAAEHRLQQAGRPELLPHPGSQDKFSSSIPVSARPLPSSQPVEVERNGREKRSQPGNPIFSHASKPDPSAHTLLTSLIEKYLSSDVCGESVTLTERDGSQGPLHGTGELQRTKAQSAGHGGFMSGTLALGRLKSEGLWQGPGQTELPREIVSENENKSGCGGTHLGDSRRTASYAQCFLGTCLSASLPGPAQDSGHTALGLAQKDPHRETQ